MLKSNLLRTAVLTSISSISLAASADDSDTTSSQYMSQEVVKIEGNRLIIERILKCPAPGTWINCMPTIGPDKPSFYCIDVVKKWVLKNCPDVGFAD